MDPTNLSEILHQKTVDQLKPLAGMCGPHGVTRKADLVNHIIQTLTSPASFRQLWDRLDTLSQKVVGTAYHNEGEFDDGAFVAQYGALPERPLSRWSLYGEPILLDLFIYNGHIPPELLPLLTDMVPPPEKFEVVGLKNQPIVLDGDGSALEITHTDTEQAGLHDLLAYLRLVDQGQMKVSNTTSRATLGSLKKIMSVLLQGDFLPLPDPYRATDTIRPFGLDVFAQEARLVNAAKGSTTLKLTRLGQNFYQNQTPELLLEAFENWVQKGSFDELSRISAIKGQNAKGTRLTKPATRREPISEALSWCPAGVWINIEDFYRAVKIWHFDFEVENSHYSNLYIDDREYGSLYGDTYWLMTKGLYINAVLWEYLGTIGAVDLLYTAPEMASLDNDFDYYNDDGYFSLYDGLKYFRVNPLGAFLLGHVSAYVPATPDIPALFNIAADQTLTLTAPEHLTPNDHYLLEQMTLPRKKGSYKLDTHRLLTSLEAGADFNQLADFLRTNHAGPLPETISTWLETLAQNTQAFKVGGQALLVKVESAALVEMALSDDKLQRLCSPIDAKTLVVPASKEKDFRARLKELGYVLAG